MIRRSARVLIEVLAILGAALTMVAVLGLWRLSAGPIELGALTPFMERAMADSPYPLSIETTQLRWDGFGQPIRLSARGVAIHGADDPDRPIATVPEIAVTLDIRSLIRGTMSPRAMALVQPTLRVVQTAQGGYRIALERPEGAAARPVDGRDPLAALLTALDADPATPQSGMATLESLSVVDALISLTEADGTVTGLLDRVDVELTRIEGGLAGTFAGRLDRAGVTVALDGTSVLTVAEGRVDRITGGAEAVLEVDGARLPITLTGSAEPAARTVALEATLDPVEAETLARFVIGLSALAPDGTGATGPAYALADPLAEVIARLPAAAVRARVDGTADGATLVSAAVTGPGGADGFEIAFASRLPAPLADLLDRSAPPGPAQSTLTVDGLPVAALTPLAGPPAAALTTDARARGTAVIDHDADGIPVSVALSLTVDGAARYPPYYPEPLTLEGVTLDARFGLDPLTVAVDGLSGSLGGVPFAASATLRHGGGTGGLALAAVARDLPAARIPDFWPRGIKPNTRSWFRNRLVAGTATEASIALELGWQDAAVTLHAMDGMVEADDITLRPLSFLPAITGIDGTARFDRQAFRIETRGGRIRDLRAGDGVTVIGNIDRPNEEFIDLDVAVVGPIETALSIIDVPQMRLGLSERLGFGPDQTGGTATARLSIDFPILEDLRFDDVDVAVTADIVDGSVRDARAGISLSALDGRLAVDRRAAALSGTAAINGVPVTFDWSELFGPGREYETRMRVDAVLGDTDWTRLLMPRPLGLSGAVPTEIEYTDYGSGGATVRGDIDLTGARIAVPQLDYAKAAGASAEAVFGLDIVEGAVASVPYFRLDGPDLHLLGAATLAPDSLTPAQISLREGRVGDSAFTVDAARRSDGGWRVDVIASAFDARAMLGRIDEDRAPVIDTRPSADAADPILPPLAVQFDLARVRVSDAGPPLDRVTGVARYGPDPGIGTRGWDIQADAALPGDGTARALVQPMGDRRSRIDIRSTDAGTLLAALDLGPELVGGTLRLEAVHQDGATARTDGTILLRDFTLVRTPPTAQVLAALSIGGLDDLLRGGGLDFSFAEARLRLQDGSLGIERGRAVGGELGLTADGVLSLSDRLVDLQGTVVPVAGVNAVIGNLPLVGRLLTGVEGAGVFGFTYAATGPFSDPRIAVNPLSILAPGFLRDLFFLDTDLEADPGAMSLRPDRD